MARVQQSFQIARDDAWTDHIFRQERFVRSPKLLHRSADDLSEVMGFSAATA
jgi:hypothetical protein